MKSLHSLKAGIKLRSTSIPVGAKNVIRGMTYSMRDRNPTFRVHVWQSSIPVRYNIFYRLEDWVPGSWREVMRWDQSYYRSLRYFAEFEPTRVVEITYA